MIPGSANPLLLKSAAAAGGYQRERSLRFNSSDSAFCSRTPAVAGNRKTWTWAGWVKRSLLGSSFQTIIGAGTGGSAEASIRFNSDDTIEFYAWTGGYNARLYTTQVFRDVSAWYHLVAVFDTPNAVADQRIRLYVNGIEITTFSSRTNPTQNYDGYFNNSISHTIGDAVSGASPRFFSGYLADIHFIDGQALTPSSFTEVSATTGQLIPKAYTGSFGTNGFWLTFSDNSATTATTLGKDSAGSNNWTPNNFSVTAGSGNDSLVDTPTSYGTDTYVGGEVRGNYCTWNPLDTASATLTNGNLDISTPSSGFGSTRGTFGVSSGKWYFEHTITSGATCVGVLRTSDSLSTILGGTSGGYSYYSEGPGYTKKINNNVQTDYGASFVAGDIIGVALDLDAGTLTFYKNGASQGQAFSGLSGTFAPAVSDGTNAGNIVGSTNFGQRAFAYTAPSGFKALVDTNLTAPVVAKPNTVMDVKLWTGDGASTRTISGFQFSPDFVWIKERPTNGWQHTLYDTIRGPGTSSVVTSLSTNDTRSEASGNDASHGYLSSFTSDGFGLTKGSQTAGDYVNHNTWTYVAWCWDAGTSTASNTQGSITSSVRANASSGFSVVTFTSPTGTGNFSVGHGLGVTPEFVIVKSRDAAGVWYVYHKSLATDYYLRLNGTNAAATDGVQWGAGMTSSVLGLRASYSTVSGATTVAYAWTPVAGYSSFGSYTGNGSADGPFVFTGHRSRWLMVRRSDAGLNDWYVLDTARSTYNVAINELLANSSSAENPYTGVDFDLLSNGFKIRATEGSINASGGTFIYASFAEFPFAYARAR